MAISDTTCISLHHYRHMQAHKQASEVVLPIVIQPMTMLCEFIGWNQSGRRVLEVLVARRCTASKLAEQSDESCDLKLQEESHIHTSSKVNCTPDLGNDG